MADASPSLTPRPSPLAPHPPSLTPHPSSPSLTPRPSPERRMPQFTGSLVKYPARASLVWYLVLASLGTLVLWQPLCRAAGREPISFLDAAFTSTSATCVTGLVVRSTPHDFSLVGQLVILALIQLGGIGIMTVTTYIMFQMGSRADLRQMSVITETIGGRPHGQLGWVLRNVLRLTAIFEGAGFVLLAIRFLFDYPLPAALWHAAFHSVSAFCNAGFALHDNSLEQYHGDVFVNVVIMLLIIIGGLGFPVLLDIGTSRRGNGRERWDGLHLHSKLMLLGTAALLVLGTGVFLLLEWQNALSRLPLWQRPLAAMFQAVTCRTAGFNTTPIGTLTNAALFFTVLLMMIGAGPCSTGGGFKVSTVMVLACHAWSAFRGQDKINVFRRTIPHDAVRRAVATAMLFAVLATVALTALLFVEQSSVAHPQSQGKFLDALFEVISALGTVGLSTGLTPHLSTAGQVIIIVLMFAGRLGPISVFVALSLSQQRRTVSFVEEEPLIG